MEKQIVWTTMATPLGPLTIGASEAGVCRVGFGEEGEGPENCGCSREKAEAILAKAQKQLAEYMEGKRKEFDLPLCAEGTDFQKRVWKELCRIPYGETRTYGQIAALVGNPKASRAVGMANHNNPIGIIVPCHRVIGSNGKLTGYAGGLDKKEGLLKLEQRNREPQK
ncbi:MAG: methylated-DNA--[protein]-cysteine S-methyltransferase [Hungatella sp.]|nr:methylated-DNA--[protein]-cysteine S-methyltransferase [Hungatella sp.]